MSIIRYLRFESLRLCARKTHALAIRVRSGSKADMCSTQADVGFVPRADILPSIRIFKYQAAAVTDNLADKTVVFSTAAIPIISSRLSGA